MPPPPGPVSAHLIGVDAGELPPLTRLYGSTGRADVSVLSGRRDRRGTESPIALLGSTEGRRWAVVQGEGTWRWAARGGGGAFPVSGALRRTDPLAGGALRPAAHSAGRSVSPFRRLGAVARGARRSRSCRAAGRRLRYRRVVARPVRFGDRHRRAAAPAWRCPSVRDRYDRGDSLPDRATFPREPPPRGDAESRGASARSTSG
jgi:hypothetical protein